MNARQAPPSDVDVRPARAADAAGVAGIYNHYVTDSVVTFEEEPVSVPEMARRVQEVQSAGMPWLVAVDGGETVGYAYGCQWRPRSGYRHSAEITVYVAPGSGGRGVGSRLYDHLFPLLASRRFHAVVGGIALPNDASVALHEKFGMRKVAHFSQVGWKLERWIDVGYWQRLL